MCSVLNATTLSPIGVESPAIGGQQHPSVFPDLYDARSIRSAAFRFMASF